MTARKLTDSEKQDILHQYRTTGETSSSLAIHYGVSTSTVSRILKSTLPPDEYEALIQQKRSSRSTDLAAESEPGETISLVEPPAAEPPEVEIEPIPPIAPDVVPVKRIITSSEKSSKPVLRQRNRTPTANDAIAEQLEVPLLMANSDLAAKSGVAEAEVLKEILSDNLIESDDEKDSDELDDELDDDLDDDLDEEDDEEYDEDSTKPLLVGSRLKDGLTVQILPLADAPIPRTCYLVIDRAAELVAPPLREFGDLGQISAADVQAKTLPVFDNHRIAKRYSNPRTQRVIKLPDGRILAKTFPHLQAKGITPAGSPRKRLRLQTDGLSL